MNPLESMFEMMKGLGYYKEYETFEDYRKDKYGKNAFTPEEKEKEFKSKMTDKERRDYEYVFGKD